MRGAKLGSALIAAVLVIYLAFALQRAIVLLSSGVPVGIAIGVALLVLPLIGIWALGRELVFGAAAERLGRRLEEEGRLPEEVVPVRASGRVLRDAADELFPKYRDEAEAAPEDWRSWYRLGLVYDGAGDRRRARSAIRSAIRLERAERRPRGAA